MKGHVVDVKSIVARCNLILPNLITFFVISRQFCPKFAVILPKCNEICLNLTNFAQKLFTKRHGCIPSSYRTIVATRTLSRFF